MYEKMEQEGNQKFSDEAIPILQRLYSNGMTGWGKDHDSNISIAITTTGLTLTQIKVTPPLLILIIGYCNY